jgi:tRNA pseudouridine38-40 synthase
MVRSIVGTLVNVGLNKITLDDFNAIIVHKTEIKLGFQYQHMVYLTEIEYDYL